MERVLITGATGFIGGHLVRVLKQKRMYHIKCLVRKSSRHQHLSELGCELAFGDIGDLQALRHAMRGVSAVVHLAAKVTGAGDYTHFEETNVRGTKNVLDAASHSPSVCNFLYLSSIAVYDGTRAGVVYENEILRPTGWHYADSKKQTEKMLRESKTRFPITILRSGDVVGEGSVWIRAPLNEMRSHMFVRIRRNKGLMNYIWVDDLTDAIFNTLENSKSWGGTFNVSSGYTVLFDQYFSDLARMAGYSWFPTMSYTSARTFASLYAHASRLLRLESDLTPHTIDYVTSERVVDISAFTTAVRSLSIARTYQEMMRSVYTVVKFK